jgi:hypothetical protein
MDFSNIVRDSLLEVYPNNSAIMESLAHNLMKASISTDSELIEATLVSTSIISKVCLNIVREEKTNAKTLV